MAGYTVMMRRPGRRAVRIYPIRLKFVSGSPTCGGLTTRPGPGPDRPCDFLTRQDAEWFAEYMARSYRLTGRDRTVFVQQRGA